MFCTSCGAGLLEGDKFCPECGLRIDSGIVVPVAPKFCTNCGLSVREGFKFCPECGTRMHSSVMIPAVRRSSAQVPIAPPTPPTPAPTPRTQSTPVPQQQAELPKVYIPLPRLPAASPQRTSGERKPFAQLPEEPSKAATIAAPVEQVLPDDLPEATAALPDRPLPRVITPPSIRRLKRILVPVVVLLVLIGLYLYLNVPRSTKNCPVTECLEAR